MRFTAREHAKRFGYRPGGTGERRPRPVKAAFTLVEVLATMVLIAIILPVAMRGISLATRTAGVAAERMEAASLAETKLAELLLAEAWISGDLSGDFEPDRREYEWSAGVSEWEGSALLLLTVRVTWTDPGGEREVSLSTLVYTGEESGAS